MKILLAAAIIASLGLVPAALAASGTGRAARNDTATALPNPYQNTGSASAALQGYTTSGPDGDCPTAQFDTSTTATNPYQNTGSASAALQGYTTSGAGGDGRTAQTYTATAPSPYENTGSASAALQGYTTSGAGTQLATGASNENNFNWGDAGIGAVGAIGAALILIGLSLVTLRRRGRLAL